ncbi:MAG TPA: PDZ domain-containing protein [Terriglobales bacterium]|jgi:predicted metalloprotease with PDZ domain|nr:PDZ domain-containing protein [Terriglobales bacterium]
MLKSFSLVLLLALLVVPAVAEGVSAAGPPPFPGYGEVYGSYMGIDIQEVTRDRMAALKLQEERGAEITMVDHDAPAGKAGLKEHDVILEFNGSKVQGTEELRRLIHETPPGRTVQLLISRDGQPLTISLQLADKKEYFAQYPKKLEAHEIPPVPPIPPIPAIPAMDVTVRTGSAYGLLVDNLTPQLGEYFGVKNGEGVLVKSVEEGTPAKVAGFKAGDVIVRVNNQKISDRGDWRSAVRANRSGKLTVGIVRDRREQNLTISLTESSRNHSSLRVPSAVVDLDLDLDLEMEQLRTELAQLRPELERARAMGLEEGRKALENARKALYVDRAEIQRAMDEARRTLDRKMKCWQKESENEQKKAPAAEY